MTKDICPIMAGRTFNGVSYPAKCNDECRFRDGTKCIIVLALRHLGHMKKE